MTKTAFGLCIIGLTMFVAALFFRNAYSDAIGLIGTVLTIVGFFLPKPKATR